METEYLPKSENYCVFAEYNLRERRTLLGYDIDVHNQAQTKDGKVVDSGNLLNAQIVDEKRGKLVVGPYFVPPFLAGPYWVVEYSEAEGYALISGGAPTLEGNDGKCRTGRGVNDSGLWIFLRKEERDEALVAKVRALAEAKGFDVNVLNDVYHSHCTK